MEDFVDRHGLDGFPHAIDPDGSVWLGFGTTTQSVFVFLNDDGTFETTSFGVLGEDELEERVDDLLSR